MEAVNNINDKITHDVTLSKRRAKREMTKKGFANVDGTIMQYNPNLSVFIPVNNADVVKYFNWIIGTSWQTLTPGNIIDYLKSELPTLTKKDVNDFKSYIRQIQVIVNEELIQDLMKESIAENESYKNINADLKGKLNLQSELIVLRNNDIFTDGRWKLYKLEDGKFTRFNAEAVLNLFRQTIGTGNTKLVLQYVKNHWDSYCDNLTDVRNLARLLKEKDHKEHTLEVSEDGYYTVLSVISDYGGK